MRAILVEDRFEAIAPTQDLHLNVGEGEHDVEPFSSQELTVVSCWYSNSAEERPLLELRARPGSTVGPPFEQEAAAFGVYATTRAVSLFGGSYAEVDVPARWSSGVPHVVASRARPGEVDVRTMLDYATQTFDESLNYHSGRMTIEDPTTINAIAVYDHWLSDYQVLSVMNYLRRATTPAGINIRPSWPQQ